MLCFASLYIVFFLLFSANVNESFALITASRFYRKIVPQFLKIGSKFEYKNIRRFSWPPEYTPKDYEQIFEDSELANTPNSHDFLPKTQFPLKVLWWTTWFGNGRFDEKFTTNSCEFPSEIPEKPQKNEVWCMQTHDRRYAKSAIFYGFHVRDTNVNKRVYPNSFSGSFSGYYNGIPAKQFLNPGQKWFLMTQEPPIYDFDEGGYNGKFILQPDKLRLFDFTMNYRLDSGVPFPYAFAVEVVTILDKVFPADDFSKRKKFSKDVRTNFEKLVNNNYNNLNTNDLETTVLWLCSNCDAADERHEYVRELQKWIPVDSFGRCMNNGKYPKDVKTVDLMKKYKFYLSLENTQCKDYVTEKLYNAFDAGVVPIVAGPPINPKSKSFFKGANATLYGTDYNGYDKFIPNRDSVIFLEEYPNPRDLARKLLEIDADENQWKRHHKHRGKWNSDPNPDSADAYYNREFRRTFGVPQKEWGLCGLCRKAARENWKNLVDVRVNGGVLTLDQEYDGNRQWNTIGTPDWSCLERGSLNPVNMMKNSNYIDNQAKNGKKKRKN